jgi:hypothetical protein
MKKVDNKYKLIGSDIDLERLKKTIDEKWFYGSKKDYRLLENNIYGVFFPDSSPKAGQQVSGVRIISKNGRFRFEMLDNKN